MLIEVKVPSPGESVTEVQLAEWLVNDGDFVEKDAEIVMIDSDKASFAIYAEESGQIKLLAKAGDTLKVGQVICNIETGVATQELEVRSQNPEVLALKDEERRMKNEERIRISPVAKRMIEDLKLNIEDLIKDVKKDKISKEDIDEYIKHQSTNLRETVREKMSTLRLKLSQRLVAVKNETAMLTTFNEVNMSAVIKIRNQFKEDFKKKYNASLGITSFFAKAASVALQEYPLINAMIDGEDIVYNRFIDIGIAVSSPKGLIVPIIRDAHLMNLTQIELKINELAEKTRNNRITIEELTGGTFTITNGGVFGSLLSTPILNPPQSAILGMHNIVERPVAIDGKIVIQPMMYIAMSYDHRLIDGKDSVIFVIRIKQLLENPDNKFIPEFVRRLLF